MSRHPAQKLAASFVVMIAAGGKHDEVVEMAQAHGVRPVHLDQLAVSEEQDASRRLLRDLLKQQR